MSQIKSPLQILTFKALGAVAARRAIGFNGAQATVQGQKVMGVSARSVADGKYSDVDVSGTTVVECGGTFSEGASLIVDNQGRAIAATGALAVKSGATAVTSSAASGAAILQGADLPEYVFADAMEAGSVGLFAEVLLRR